MSSDEHAPIAQSGNDAVERRLTSVAIVERIFQHTAEARSLFLRPTDGRRIFFLPGQFLSLQLPVDGEILIRPYSIASHPENPELLEICLNLVPGGQGSHYLFSLPVGAVVHFTGPWGTFFLRQSPEAESVFLAEGTGIVPIRPMLWRALSCGGQFPLRLLYSAAQEQDLLYRNEFAAWAQKNSRLVFEPLLRLPPEGWSGLRGTLMEQVEARYVQGDTDRNRHFYICGIGKPVLQLRDLLRRAGYQRRAVLYEKW